MRALRHHEGGGETQHSVEARSPAPGVNPWHSGSGRGWEPGRRPPGPPGRCWRRGRRPGAIPRQARQPRHGRCTEVPRARLHLPRRVVAQGIGARPAPSPLRVPRLAVVVHLLRRNARTQQLLHRLGRDELRGALQPAMAAVQSVHTHHYRLLAWARQRIRCPNTPTVHLLAHPRRDPPAVQPLYALLRQDAPPSLGAACYQENTLHVIARGRM